MIEEIEEIEVRYSWFECEFDSANRRTELIFWLLMNVRDVLLRNYVRLSLNCELYCKQTNYELRITNYKLQTTNYELRTTNYKLRATSHELRAANYRNTKIKLRVANISNLEFGRRLTKPWRFSTFLAGI